MKLLMIISQENDTTDTAALSASAELADLENTMSVEPSPKRLKLNQSKQSPSEDKKVLCESAAAHNKGSNNPKADALSGKVRVNIALCISHKSYIVFI